MLTGLIHNYENRMEHGFTQIKPIFTDQSPNFKLLHTFLIAHAEIH